MLDIEAENKIECVARAIDDCLARVGFCESNADASQFMKVIIPSLLELIRNRPFAFSPRANRSLFHAAKEFSFRGENNKTIEVNAGIQYCKGSLKPLPDKYFIKLELSPWGEHKIISASLLRFFIGQKGAKVSNYPISPHADMVN